jgi:hypothetical protein
MQAHGSEAAGGLDVEAKACLLVQRLVHRLTDAGLSAWEVVNGRPSASASHGDGCIRVSVSVR